MGTLRKLTEVDRINSNGWGKGWHADMLKGRAQAKGATMAQVFEKEVEGSPAFNVPATCTKIVGERAYYQYMDGSTSVFHYQKRKYRD